LTRNEDFMNAIAPRIKIERIIKPRSVAVIGASQDEAKFGGRIMANVLRHGYAGELVPINPNRDSIFGKRAYPSIAAAPGPIDLVVIAVPAAQLKRTIEDCGAAGVGACVVITAQLGEFDAAGAKLQDEIVKVAAGYGMRLIGPNCMGLITATHALGLTSSPTLQYADRLRPGSVGFVSQSGALMGALFVHGHDHGVGFTSMVSVGNQADLELSDFFEGLIADDETNTICLYVEAIKDAPRFVALARRARERGKRVVAIKAGRTEAGSAMARSHTASLAGSFAAFEAVCRENGILLMDEPEAMIMTAGVLARAPRLGTGGVGLVVSSGGGGAVTADRMAAAGLPLAQWSDATRARLDKHFLRTHQNNPIDLGAHIGALGPHIFKDAIEAVAEDEDVAAFMYIMTPQPLMPQTIDAVMDVWRRGKKPVIFVLDTSRFGEDVRQRMHAAGMPFVTRIDDALRVLELLVRERDSAAPSTPAAAVRPAGAGPLPSLAPGFLIEPEAKTLLGTYGIATTRERTVRSADDAVRTAEEIGYPVVAKGVSRKVVHKSDLGLVRLNLADAHAVRTAFESIAKALAKAGDTEATSVVIAEMVRGEAELIIGARRDASFGAQVLVGFGGVMVEIMHDVQVASAPVSRARAHAMLRQLKLWPLLDGARGRPRLDVEAVAEALIRLSWLAHDLGERLSDLEINPLIVRVVGGGAVAVDARGTIVDA
jgi:acyl-CoA synthetase (NDP forming)